MADDPFANIPNADDSEYAGTELATPAEQARQYQATSYCPSCGDTVRWSTVYSPAHWVHSSNLAVIQCSDITALDFLPGPGIRPALSGCTCGGIGDTGSHFAGCVWAVAR